MWGKVKKFAPLAALAGYLLVYKDKGMERIMVDLQSITVAKLQAKWQQLAMAAAAGVALYFLKSVRLPTAIKTLIVFALYLFIGYNIGLAIDPVGCGAKGEPSCRTGYVVPKAANPYSPGGR